MINVENIKNSLLLTAVGTEESPKCFFLHWGGCVLLLGLDPASPAHYFEKSGAGYYHLVIGLQQPA